MIVIKLNETLVKKKKSLNWLHKETGITYAALLRIKNGQTKAMEFLILDKICNALKCDTSDIVKYAPMAK